MVKKFYFKVQQDFHEDGDAAVTSTLHEINNALHSHLTDYKNKITQFHRNKKWDRFKKLTNDYELVFTTSVGFPSIASYNPISRSYFKLWEILCDLGLKEMGLSDSKTPTRAAFLADAPGGFMEAFVNFRQRHKNNSQDDIFGMSLRATNRIIPQWKFDAGYCTRNNIKLCYGSKGTGDLYDLENIRDFVSVVGAGSCQLVTADGGFDFSSDFNHQELMSMRLILCEVYAALHLQAQGGSLVLKIFDIHNHATISMLYILSVCYESLFFVKPLSSRPANSEKYVVCTGFKGALNTHKSALENAINQIAQHGVVEPHIDVSPNPSFLSSIVDYNEMYTICQILHINETLSMIKDPEITRHDHIVRQQVRKAIKWCHKYEVPVSLEALKKYRAYFPPSLPTTG